LLKVMVKASGVLLMCFFQVCDSAPRSHSVSLFSIDQGFQRLVALGVVGKRLSSSVELLGSVSEFFSHGLDCMACG